MTQHHTPCAYRIELAAPPSVAKLKDIPLLEADRQMVDMLILQVITNAKCVVLKDLMLEGLPQCRLRLVANHVGEV